MQRQCAGSLYYAKVVIISYQSKLIERNVLTDGNLTYYALVALEVGDEITFHISRLKSVRTQASELGAIYNRQFKTRTDREKQTITVMRTL